jgi:hypothetical protein
MSMVKPCVSKGEAATYPHHSILRNAALRLAPQDEEHPNKNGGAKAPP